MGVMSGPRPPNTPALPYHRGDSHRTHVQELCDKQYNQKDMSLNITQLMQNVPQVPIIQTRFLPKPAPFTLRVLRGDLRRDGALHQLYNIYSRAIGGDRWNSNKS